MSSATIRTNSKPLRGLLISVDENKFEVDFGLFNNDVFRTVEFVADLKRILLDLRSVIIAVDHIEAWVNIKNSTNFNYGHNRGFVEITDLARHMVATIEGETLRQLMEPSQVAKEALRGLEDITSSIKNEVNRHNKGELLEAIILSNERARILAIDSVTDKVQDIAYATIDNRVSLALDDAISKFKEVKANSDFSTEFDLQLQTLKVQKELGSNTPRETVAELRERAGRRKTAWFWTLVVVSVVYTAALVLSTYIPTPVNSVFTTLLPEISGLDALIIKTVLALPIIILFLRFAHYSRLSKVYSNLEEQYRHKTLVSKTVTGLLKAIEKGEVSDVDEQLLQELRKEAAKAIFEQKSIGHLGGKEKPSIIGEVLGNS